MAYIEVLAWGFGISLFLYFAGWGLGYCFDLCGVSDDLAWNDRYEDRD